MKAAHVPLCRERIPAFVRDRTKPLSSALPYYQPEGADRYVHVLRSGHMHYNHVGKLTHVSYKLWCGMLGFGSGIKSRGSRRPSSLVVVPDAGRLVCATCLARSIGSGQAASASVPTINGQAVKFTPRAPFMASAGGAT